MNHDLGIRAAVRAATARESDYWHVGLAGWSDGNMDRTPFGAMTFAQEYEGDTRDASAMAWWTKTPRYAPRRFLKKVTP